MKHQFDFSGWATKNDLLCSDGKTIKAGAFKHNDGSKVPLVWQHDHNNPSNVIGHAVLENRDEGVYMYGKFNDTRTGQDAKLLVKHGDISAISIFANKVKLVGTDVIHGNIREVSLVLAGANPGAMIDLVYDVVHADDEADDFEAVLYTGTNIEHSESEDVAETDVEHAETQEKTVQDIVDSMTEEQRNVLYYIVGTTVTGDDETVEQSDIGGEEMRTTRNVFDQEANGNDVEIKHSDILAAFEDAKSSKSPSLKETFLAHGIEQIAELYPTAKASGAPEFIARDMEWVSTVMGGITKSPISRLKSLFADITADEARALGYIKGRQKIEEKFGLLKRETAPTTVYKLQKLDRDDIIDITDFNVVSWLKEEMRVMLNEELARAFLIGDGRAVGHESKIDPSKIRPVYGDDPFYTIYKQLPAADGTLKDANSMIDAVLRARSQYRGSGSLVMFIAPEALTDILILKKEDGDYLFKTEEELRSKLRVSKIVEVPVFENATRTATDGTVYHLKALLLNLRDYKSGADRGGEINMFDDFDIDFNKYKYLIETRCSGALMKPYSAIALETTDAAGESDPETTP